MLRLAPYLPLLLLLPLGACAAPKAASASAESAPLAQVVDTARDIVLVVHGGAGTLDRAAMGPELEREFRATLTAALEAGYAALAGGAPAVEGVLAAVALLEDSPLFNAGRGAVLTHERRHELDASLMVSVDGVPQAGAVAGVTTVRNPLALARAVMERTPHVLLTGAGAERFADETGVERVENGWFTTPRRVEQLERALAEDARAAAPRTAANPYFGTVGCVARGAAGDLAAGTSTGGMTNKRFGRVGDSPVLGAGTWADSRTAAVSCTGHGEYFLRGAVAHDVHARMRYGRASVAEASAATLADLSALGGEGGWIALTAAGDAAAPYNSGGMYRGWIDSEGRVTVRIWAD